MDARKDTMFARRPELLVLVAAVLWMASASCFAQDPSAGTAPIVIFFYEEGCPDCVKIEEVLDALESELPEGAIARHEIGDSESRRLFQKLQKAYEIDVSSVPVVFIGDRVIAGATLPRELELTDAIGDCITGACSSPLDRVPAGVIPWRDALELALLVSLVLLLALLQLP